MPVLKNHDRFWRGNGTVAIYGDYRPWGVHKQNGGTKDDYPAHSGRILDLKDGKADAVQHFKDMIEPELSDDVVIVTVPSHDPEKKGGGLADLAACLATGTNRVDGSACLVRKKKIKKLAHGGERAKDVHLQSIQVTNAQLLKGKNVFLLDDVTKTGNSLAACAELLINAGAKSVQCATIGKT